MLAWQQLLGPTRTTAGERFIGTSTSCGGAAQHRTQAADGTSLRTRALRPSPGLRYIDGAA